MPSPFTSTPPDFSFLSKGEWSLILDVMNGHLFMDDPDFGFTPGMSSIKDEVMPIVEDALYEFGLWAKWGVHTDVMMTKLNNLTDEQWQIVRHVIEGFWDSTDLTKAIVPGAKRPE